MPAEIQKVPIILQMEALECGAASLAMILAHYKKFVPLEKLRVECSVSRDGCNAKNVLKAARNNGLNAKGFSFTADKLLKGDIKFPAIIHWNFNHFVVLCGFKRDKAILADPAEGLVKIPMEEFRESFTGIVLTFEKGEEFKPEGKKKGVMGFLMKRLKGEVVSLSFIVYIGLLSTIIGTVISVFSKVYVDNVLFGKDPGILIPLLTVMAGTAGISFILTLISSLNIRRIKGKMSVTSGAMFMWHVLRMPVEFFSQRFAGDIAARQGSNDEVANMICDKIAPIALNVIMIVVYFAVIVYYDLTMSLVGLFAALLNIVVIKMAGKKNINDNKSLMRDGGKVAGASIAGLNMMETLKASGCEAGFFHKWAGYQTKYNNAAQRIRERNMYVYSIPGLLQGLSGVAILMLGVYKILSGSFTVGTLIAFQGFMSSFLGPVNAFVNVGQDIQAVSGTIERIEDVLNYKADVDIDFAETTKKEYQNKTFEKLGGGLEIRNLNFSYSPLGDPIIKDFNLKIEKGQMIALVGGSGSGKSTIAKVIAGLYQPRSGEILFDGRRREDIDRNVFRGSLSVVDQDVTLFLDTVRNNITMWDSSIDDSTLIEACTDACIHDDIIARGDGYDHELIENGRDFSGGQRQRFEIARSFVANPTIMILDEATSALDPTTEKKVMDAVKRRGITCIVVAHRLSTIRDANEIIMLEYGDVVERGTHEQLIKLGGKYAKLVKSE